MNELMLDNPFLPVLDILKYVILVFPVVHLLLRLMTQFQRQDKWLILGWVIIATVAWFPAAVLNSYSPGFVLTAALVLAGWDLHKWQKERRQNDQPEKAE